MYVEKRVWGEDSCGNRRETESASRVERFSVTCCDLQCTSLPGLSPDRSHRQEGGEGSELPF